MHKILKTSNLIKSKNTSFELIKIKRSKDDAVNALKNLKIINEKMLDEYTESINLKKIIKKEDYILKHPIFMKKISETSDTETYKMVTLTHSPKIIKINNDIVKTVKVGSYWKDGKEVFQYATEATCLIVVKKKTLILFYKKFQMTQKK